MVAPAEAEISKRIMSTEQAGLTTAATFGYVLLAKRWVDNSRRQGERVADDAEAEDGDAEVEEDQPESPGRGALG